MTDYVLKAADEWTHSSGKEPNFNESVYTNAFDHDRRFGGWMRLGNRVNERYAELAVCIYLPDGRIACQFQRPEIDSNDVFEAGGLRYTVESPFERVNMTYRGEVMVLPDNTLLRDAKRLFEHAPRASCEIEWRHRGCSPVHGGVPVSAEQETMFGRDFSLGHFNQHTVVEGHISIGGETFDFGGFGWRDHSWGPRLWQNIVFDRGFYASFGANRGITLLKIANRDGMIRRAGVLFRDGAYETITDLDVLTEWNDDKDPVAVLLTARSATWSAVIHGSVLNLAPLRNRRRIDDEMVTSRIAEAFTEFEWDGHRGYGMTEYVERIEDGQPVAFPL